jgi:hypothetical protein
MLEHVRVVGMHPDRVHEILLREVGERDTDSRGGPIRTVEQLDNAFQQQRGESLADHRRGLQHRLLVLR